MMDRIVSFFRDNVPDLDTLVIAAPVGFVWAFACLSLAAWLKQSRGWKTGYTRKVFHFLIFTTAAVCRVVPGWGTPVLCVVGGMVSLVLLYAIIQGEGHPLYEAIAREKDRPHRTWYIVGPYFATLIGGMTAVIWFEPFAVAGFLVAGVADAVAEPIGTRFGRHRYRVITATKTKAERSLEGSAAVFLATLLCIAVAALLTPVIAFDKRLIWAALLIAGVCTLVEAVCPHGWDNLPMQLLPAWLLATM